MTNKSIKKEEAISFHKLLYDKALEVLEDTFFVFDPKTGKAIYWNKAFNRISGYSDDEIRSMKAPDSYYSIDDLKIAAVAIRSLAKKETFTVEMSLINKGGETIPTEYVGSAIKDKKGDLKYVIAIGRDITKRKWAEEKLAQAEERYRTVADFTYNLEVDDFYDSVAWKT